MSELLKAGIILGSIFGAAVLGSFIYAFYLHFFGKSTDEVLKELGLSQPSPFFCEKCGRSMWYGIKVKKEYDSHTRVLHRLVTTHYHCPRHSDGEANPAGYFAYATDGSEWKWGKPIYID